MEIPAFRHRMHDFLLLATLASRNPKYCTVEWLKSLKATIKNSNENVFEARHNIVGGQSSPFVYFTPFHRKFHFRINEVAIIEFLSLNFVQKLFFISNANNQKTFQEFRLMKIKRRSIV